MERYKLGDICKIVSGSTPKTGIKEYWNGNIKWITPAELRENSYIITDSVKKITELAVKKTGLSSFPRGTVILSSRAPIGKVAIAGCEMYCNQGFKNLICSEKIYNKYLYWFLKKNNAYLNSLGRGATFKEISKSIVAEIEISIPKMEEQKEIVRRLEKLVGIIKLRQKELDVLDNLIKARFVELFDSDIRKSNMTISDVAEETTVGIANSATHAYSDSGVVMLRNQNIRVNYLDDSDLIFIKKEFAEKYKKKALRENDILVTRTGANVGMACVVPKKYAGCQTFTTLILRLRKDICISPVFVCHYINSPIGKLFVEGNKIGGGQPNFGAKQLATMPIIIPDKKKQDDFDLFVNQVDKSKLIEAKSLNLVFSMHLRMQIFSD